MSERPTQPKRKAATNATAALNTTHKRKRSSPSKTESDESMASTQTCPPNLSSNSAQSRPKRRHMIKIQQIQNKSIVSTIMITAARNQDDEETNFSVDPLFTNTDVPNTALRLPEL